MKKLNIKTGDTVKVIAGSAKGKTGKVLQAFPRLGRIVVEGVNVSKRHVRARSNGQKGQVVEFFMPINASNAVLVESGKTPRAEAKPKN
jgi:large subunit ribosomal protein L24